MKLPFVSALMEKMSGGDRPPLEKYYAVVFVIIFAFLVADLGNLFARRFFIPDNIPPKKMAPSRMAQNRTYQFPGVVARNIFNSDGVIPQTQSELQGGGGTGEDNDPRPSTLGLDLVGTLVHADPSKSIATINLRGQNKIEPYMVDEEISGMARITQVLRQRVIFRNLQNQLLEYVEVPADAGISLSLDRGATVTLPKEQEKTEYTFPRAEINAQLENLPALLQQARVVPEAGPDGQVRCYKMVEMQPGSIYEKLGLRVGDCLSSVNGEPINSPQKAMEMYQMLKESSEIRLGFDRNGSTRDHSYQIR